MPISSTPNQYLPSVVAERGRQGPARVLVVDDNAAIHEDFRKILCPPSSVAGELLELEEAIFGETPPAEEDQAFDLAFANQGEQGAYLLSSALAEERPFLVAFVDMRMPPGWDGVRTAQELWRLDERLQIVFCTAFSDYSFEKMSTMLGRDDRWVVLKKPFEPIEIRQLARSLSAKWQILRSRERELGYLDDLVLKRTAALEKTHKRAQDQALERSRLAARTRRLESLGRLAAAVSHEVNNPLSYLLASLDFVVEGIEEAGPKLSDELREQLQGDIENARHGARRIQRIISDMQLLGSRRGEVSEAVDLDGILELCIRRQAESIRGVDLRCERARSCKGVKIMGRPEPLEKVLDNVIQNGAKAARDGREPWLRITVREERALGEEVERMILLEIEDSGIGIAPEKLEHVFEPFYSNDEPGTGLGLGLAVCRGILWSFGGDIELLQGKGGGTLARISLRCLEAPEEPTEPAPTAHGLPAVEDSGIGAEES